MFWRCVRESFLRPNSRRRALWAVVAIALGTTVAAAMLSVSLEIGDQMGRELRSLGANIDVGPAADSLPVEIGGIDYRPVSEGAYLAESSLSKLKEIFWRNNVIAFAPFLYLPARVLSEGTDGPGDSSDGSPAILVGTWFDHPFFTSDGERFSTGLRSLQSTWQIEGEWIDDSQPDGAAAAVVIGRSLAERTGLRPGDAVTLAVRDSEPEAAAGERNIQVQVKGILTTGGAEDEQVFAPMAMVQSLAGLEDYVRKVQVSALIKPEDDFSRRDPATMTPAEYDRWYCSPYISSILHQIEEVLPDAAARQVRHVAETQGNVLSKLIFLMGLLAVLALAAASLSISSLAGLAVLERRQEIGLMKAIGAQDGLVAAFFLAEAALQGLAGGAIGFGGGLLLARFVGRMVFDAQVAVNWTLLPLVLLIALGVSFLGMWAPLRRAVRFEPALVLRGE